MGKLRLTTGGQEVLTEDPRDAQRTADLRKFRLQLDQEKANKSRDDALKSHLQRYKDDPIAQALATAEFYAKEEDAQKAREQAEYDSIVSQHSDPVLQGLALAEHYSKKQQAPAAQKAFAESERVDQLLEQEKTARKLDQLPLGLGSNALTRETIGSAVNVVPSLAAPIARVGEAVGLIPEKAADQLYRDSQQFSEGRELARQDDLAPYLSRMYGGASQSLLQMAGTPGGAASKIIGSGVMSGSEALTTAEDAGLKGGARLRYAGTQGLFEAGIAALGQKIFGAGIESRLAGQTIAAETWKQLGKNIGMDALKEMPEEVLTTILQDLSSKWEGVSPDLTLKDFISNSIDSAVQAAMMAGMAGAPNAGRLAAQGFTKTPEELRRLRERNADPLGFVPTEETAGAESGLVQPSSDGQTYETPVLSNPAIDAFIADQGRSAKVYEAAVEAGMPALPNANRKERARYAAEKRAESQQPAQDPATLEPTAQMEPPPAEIVPAEDFGWLQEQLESDQQPIGMQEAPAGTQDVAMPAESQEVTQPAAPPTPEQFEAEYLDTKARFEQATKGTPEHDALKERMGQLFAADPYRADEIEKKSKTPPNVETGGASPDPSLPPMADPVSTTETPVATGVPSPAQSPPEAAPVSEPPKGSIGFNSEGVPIFESKTGIRSVGQDMEQPAGLEFVKGGQRAVFTGPREDRFKTTEELAMSQDPPGHTQYHSGLSRSPAEVDEAIASGKGVGVSAFSSLTAPIRKKLVDYANADGKVFIDSGAFSALMKNTTIDWDKVLFAYHEMVSSVAKDKRPNVSIVAPDIVGDHDATFELQRTLRDKFEPFLESGATVIFPVQQGGHGTLAANFADLTDTFGSLMESVTLGVPFNAKAWSQDDVLEFMRSRDKNDPGRPFHLLGGGPSKVEKLFEAAKAEGLSTEGVSADAMPKKISQRRGGKAPVPAFSALPQKSQDLFNKAFESNDVDSLKQMVDKNNLAWNAEWESRTGNKLPRGLKARHQAVLDWVGPQAKPEPSATEHDRLYKELQPLYRDPKHKAGDREHMERIRDLEQQVEFHKPAAVARAQAEIDAEVTKKPKAPDPVETPSTPAATVAVGDRVSFADRKTGETLTGNVTSVDSETGEARIRVEKVAAPGGVPIGRVEYRPSAELKKVDQAAKSPEKPAEPTEQPVPESTETPEAEKQSGEIEFRDVSKGLNLPGTIRTVLAVSGDKALLLELRNKTQLWVIHEAKPPKAGKMLNLPARGKEISIAVPELKKAKEVAARIFAGKFDPEADLWFWKDDPAGNQGYSNAGFGKLIREEKGKNKFADTLRRDGLATDGRMMVVVNDSDKATILKAIGETVPPDRSFTSAKNIIDEVTSELQTSRNPAEFVGYRGGDIEMATVNFRAPDGEIHSVQRPYHDTVMKRYPKADTFVVKSGAIAYESGGQLVALVMPVENTGDIHLDMMKKGNYPYRDRPAKTPEAPAQSQPEDPELSQAEMMEEELRAALLGETPAKPKAERKPRTPKSTSSLSPEAVEQLRTDVANNNIGFMRTLNQDKISRAKERLNEKGNTPREVATLEQNIQRYEAMLSELDKMERPAKPKTPRVEAAKKKSEDTAAALKAAADEVRKQFNFAKKPDIKGGLVPVLTREQMKAVAGLVKAALDHGVSKFNEFVAYVVDEFDEDMARQMADGIELAWKTLKRLPDYSGIDDAGKVDDVLASKKDVTDDNENRPERDDSAGDGGREAAGRPLGEGGMEETSANDVSADAEGGDAGRRGDAGSEGSGGETSGTVQDGDEGAGSVPDGAAGDDRPSGRSGRLDYRITGEDRIGEKFHPKERFDKNVEAIKVLKQIESENRRATPEEQKVLAQYVGWGGLKEAFSTRADQGLREKAILKDLLTEEELAQARTSVRNAHYTSPEVISAMWEGLTDAGFAGGRILEPSAGIGHFYGLVPESVAEVSKLSGIEMDGLTARIAQQLYQTADITHAPYQDVNVKNLQDLVISNVPFGDYKAKDKYNKALKKKSSIHNFFFLKAMTNVRPGGVIAFITSRYTMDGRTAEHIAVREQITAGGGRFVGAVRLPNNAFMGIAKTKVTTDVIFIQKEAGDAQPWIGTKEDAGGFIFNEYFHEHPENVLGKIDPKGGTQINEWGIAPDGHDIGKELAQKIAAMPFDKSAMAENSTENDEATEDIGEDADVKDGRLSIRGGKLFKAVGGKLEPVVLWGGDRGQERKFEVIRAMANLAAVRDKLSELETSSLATDDQIERARKQLNTAYDRFVAENGFVHKAENKGLFRPDEQLPTLLALEEWDTDTKTATKADVFEKRVQRPADSATNPTTAEGAAVESYARLGRIDLPMISDWLGKPASQVEQELTGWAYKDPGTGEWSLKNVYLSGNIAKKLKDAEAAAKKNPAFQKNVEDLKRVLPPRKKAGEIHVRPRSPFITSGQYTQFMQHMGVNGVLRHDDFTGSWQLDNPHIEDPVKAGPWGVLNKTAADLFEGLLNNKPPVIWGKDHNGDRVVNHAATQLARAKAKEIEDEFGRWIFTDPERAKQIEDGFNDGVGAFIEGEWDGGHLTLPGMNINITLLPHQKNAIWRAIVTGNIMLAHEVGLGKTWIMAAIAMERKRLGLASNQMFVVPNHLLSQWVSEFKALYPSAKLLALESDQINSENRRTLMERVKSGRFDAIIVTPEAYKKMPMSNEIVQAKLNEITQKIEDTIKEARKAKGDNKNFVAKLESVLESIRGKMEVMLNDPAKDQGAKFDEMGIDAIYVDEAHEYRNLWSMTQMGDISGVGLDGNQKTFDMLLKTDYLNQKTNNRGIVFATGTPIANSISELYSMQRYLQPHTLAEAGVASFDDWANTFGEAVTDIEVDPTGSGFRSKTRFKEFRNTIALSKIFRQVADVKYAEDVGLDTVRPKLRGGKLHAIQVMPSLGLLGYVRDLVRRLEISKKRSFDKRIDNPLKVTTDGRKAALDMRLVVPEEDGISSKINHAVENVARIHREEGERKGAQLIWVNLGTPASAKKGKKQASDDAPQDQDPDSPDAKMDNEEAALESGRINAYEDIKQKLITQGIPENEIAFIHDHDSKDRKRALFQKVRDGKIRILISTVKKLATGANIQTRLAAMHFLDPPWKPADIEQALGRAIRRGNKYKDWGGVQAFTYVTRGSFDAYIWQLLENKAKAIKQIMRGESDSVEDTGRIELNADEVKALASSNPKVLELVKVRNDVGQLRAEYYGYRQEQGNIQSGIANKTHSVDYRKRYLKGVEEELQKLPSRDDLHSDFKVKIGNKEYSKRSEIGAAMVAAMPVIDSKDEAKKAEQIKELAANPVKIGTVLGKTLFAGRSDYDGRARIYIGQKDGDYFNPSDDDTGNGVRLFNYFDAKYDEPSRVKANIAQEEKELEALKQRAGVPWPKEARLKAGDEKLRSLEAELGSAAGYQGTLPVVSALTKMAIMAEKLGRQEGRPVTFDGTRWMHGDRTPVKENSVTTEMESEVDREVLLLLRDSDESPQESFFFHKNNVPEFRRAAEKAKEELKRFQLLNTQYNKVMVNEWKRITTQSTPWTGIPISKEMSAAIAGRIMGAINVGVKRFEVFVLDMLADRELSKDLIVGVKPRLISTWNAAKGRYVAADLDEATEEAFDAAVAKHDETEVEEALETAQAEVEPPVAAETPDPAAVATEPEQTYSTKNAFSAAERERLGMGERPAVERQGREASIEQAKSIGETKYGSERINALIRELTQRPRAVTPQENDLLNYRNAELGEKLEALLRKQTSARRDGNDALEAASQRDARLLITEKQNLIQQVLEPIGTIAGRALQARKAVIDEEFTMVRQALLFEAAHGRAPNGAELEAMQKQIDDLKASLAELQKQHDEQAARNNDLQAKLKEAHDALVNATPVAPAAPVAPAPVPAPAATPVEKTQTEKSREKVDAAYKRLKAVFGNLYSIETATAEALGALTELATAYAELGVVSLGDFLGRIKKRMGPEAEKLIPLAKQAWKNVTSTTMGDLQNRITSKIDPMDDDTIGRAARDLHRFVIERDGLDASAEGRQAAVDAVHQILVNYVPELTKDDTARAMSGIGIYSPLSDDEIDAIRRDQKAQLLLIEQITDWKKGQAPPATGQERPAVSDEQRALRKLVNAAKKAAGIVTATPGQLRSALDAAKRMAQNRITDLTQALESGQRIAKNQKLLVPDAELTALREERDALQKLYDSAFGKNVLSDEQRRNAAEKALDRAISNLEADLQAGKLYKDAPKPRLTSAAIEAKRAALAALKASRDEMRIQSGEAQARSDAAYERHLLERDAELARRMAVGDFMPPAKKKPRELTPAMLKTMLSIKKQQDAILKQRQHWVFQNRHPVYRALMKGPVAVSHVLRKGLTVLDQSLIGRQGYLLGITHPITYAKSIRAAFPSNIIEAKSLFATEADLFNTMAALDADERWVRLETIGKVAVVDVEGGANREEGNQFVPAWFDKIPGVGASERAGAAFLNTQRRLVFRSLVEKLATKREQDGMPSLSEAELRVVGNLVNVASGRGSLGAWANSLEALTMVFFSPRWWMSRLAWWSGQPVWHESQWFGGEGASWDVRKMAALEWAKQAGAQAAIMGIAIAGLMAAFGDPGEDEEWDWYGDWRSPNFGRIRIRNSYIDMTAGLGQHLALFARLFSGKQVNRWDVTDVDALKLLGSHERGKLAPVPSMIVDYLVGESIDQSKFGSKEWLFGSVAPLMVQDVVELTKAEGVPLGSVLATMMFFGITANSREAKVKARTDISNELRAAKKQNQSPEKIQRLLNDHLKNSAAIEAKQDLRTANPEEVAGLEKVIAGEASPELDAAIQKEKYDLTLRAVEMLSSEDRKSKKNPGDDKAITDARGILRTIAPTYEEANALFSDAYKQRHGKLSEVVGPVGDKQFVIKKSVAEARKRLKEIYGD